MKQHDHPFTIPETITTTVEAIMAHNRARFAGWTMEAEGAASAAGEGDAGTSTADGAAGGEDPDSDALGDKGKQAIDRMKADRNAARAELKQTQSELEKLRNASKTEQEKAIDAARKEGESAASQRANARIVRAEVKALAATAKFRDPGDVLAQLGDKLNDITVDDDGDVDETALKALVDGLAKSKPYLIDTGSTTATAADAGIGTTGSNTKPDPGPGRARLASVYAGTSKS
jgi:hypothetical protein